MFLWTHKTKVSDLESGKFINCGNREKKEENTRLGSKTTYNVDATTGIKWISVICTKTMKKGDEVFIDYGDTYLLGHRWYINIQKNWSNLFVMNTSYQ